MPQRSRCSGGSTKETLCLPLLLKLKIKRAKQASGSSVSVKLQPRTALLIVAAGKFWYNPVLPSSFNNLFIYQHPLRSSEQALLWIYGEDKGQAQPGFLSFLHFLAPKKTLVSIKAVHQRSKPFRPKFCIEDYLFCVITILSSLVDPVVHAVCEQTKGGHAKSDGVYQASPVSASKFAVSSLISH